MKKLTILIASALIAHNVFADSNTNTAPAQVTQSAEWIKDIIPEQNEIYTISPGSGQPHRNTTDVSVWVNHPNNTYRIGDNIVISVKANRSGYLTMIDVGAGGNVRQIFPNRFQSDNYLHKGDIIKIPALNADFHYRISGPTGTELIKTFISDSSENIYGKSASSFNKDYFPLSSNSTDVLRKDIVSELNTRPNNSWSSYNKVIHIISRNNTASVNNNINSALRAEQALHLTTAQIRSIQRHLYRSGYYSGNIDGVIGSNTRKAIAAWQQVFGIPATGYINAQTFTQLIIN